LLTVAIVKITVNLDDIRFIGFASAFNRGASGRRRTSYGRKQLRSLEQAHSRTAPTDKLVFQRAY
jgi:hypothetical protein